MKRELKKKIPFASLKTVGIISNRCGHSYPPILFQIKLL